MCLMLSAFALTIQAQQKVSHNQNKRNMENKGDLYTQGK